MSELKYLGHDNLLSNESDLQNYNNYVSKLIADRIRAHKKLNSKIRVLDFGAGIGTISFLVAKKLNLSIDCFELDEYQKKVISKRTGLSLVNKIKSNYYDVIFSSNVLEHIEDDNEQVKVLSNSIRRDGILITYLPAFECLWSKMDDHVGHFRRYDRNKVQKLLSDRFNIIENNYVDFVGFFLALIFKYSTNTEKPSILSLKIFDNFLLPMSKFFDIFCSRLLGKNLFTVAQKKH